MGLITITDDDGMWKCGPGTASLVEIVTPRDRARKAAP